MHKTKLILLDDWPLTTQDDLIVAGASGVAARLAKGTDGQVLTVDPTTHHLLWATPAAGGMTNPMTTAADLIVGGTSGTPARLAKGSDGQVLTVDPTTHLLVWATPSSSSGASTSDHYIVGQGGEGDSDLSNKVVIPGLSASPDIRVAATNDDEFDTTDTTDPMTGYTTLGTPSTHNINSTAKSHYYIKATAVTHVVGIYKAVPSIPFTVTCKVTDYGSYSTSDTGACLILGEATPGKLLIWGPNYNGSLTAEIWTNRTTFFSTPITGGASDYGTAPWYLRYVVNSSTSIDVYASRGGLIYSKWGNVNPGFTVGSVGLGVDSETGAIEALFDWIRFA